MPAASAAAATAALSGSSSLPPGVSLSQAALEQRDDSGASA